jgi:anti-sigma factor ChrR (cupin superfamily)
MSEQFRDIIDFDDVDVLALAESAELVDGPRPEVKSFLMTRIAEVPAVPEGFVFSFSRQGWQNYPLPGIRMKVLALSRAQDTATILIDAAAGARFPAHHHGGDEECYVVSGDVHTLGRTLGPGDFLHADLGTEHDEIYTERGALVLLVVRPEDYIPGFVRQDLSSAPSAR